jgi:hypothetical protein
VKARAVAIQTPTPGFAVQVYAAERVDLSLPYGDSASLSARGWHGPLAADSSVKSGAQIAISTARPYRFYLIWMTALPPGSQSATIADITLYR